MLRKIQLFLFSILLSSLMTSCTTRYQDMLHERDARIRELSGDIAKLRGENEDLMARRETAPQPSNASAPKADAQQSELTRLQSELGDDAQVSYRKGRISIGVDDTVTFDAGSTALKDSAHRVLRNVAGALKGKYSGRRFYIEGHTDTDPISKTKDRFRSNRHLSSERADSVAAYLIQQGVPEASIVVVGYGQYDPRDPKAKAKNRRVEIVVGDPY